MKDNTEPQRRFKKFKADNASKTVKSELYKPPTVEELNQLRETEILFNSNIFRLQTDELVKEVFVKQKRKREIETWIQKLQTLMTTLPEYTQNKFADFELCVDESATKGKLSKHLKEIAQNVPVTLKTDQNASVKLLRPTSAETIGLYRVNAITGPKINVTLNIVMPKLCFNEKDYLNSRYLVKRNLYLSYIACNLTSLTSRINYQFLDGNQLLPILEIIPKEAKNCHVRIIVTPEENTFKLGRFSCDKSNLRCTYFNSSKFNDTDLPLNNEEQPTPFYNASILHDLTLHTNDSRYRDALTGLKGASDGLILLSIWLKQRELSNSFGGFTEQLMYALVAYLIKCNRINKHMSSYQVIRNIWNHLVQSEWDVKGPSSSDTSSSDTSPDIDEFHRHYNVVFIDTTGSYNLAANLDVNIYRRVKFEAQLALKYLDEGKLSSFQSLFMVKMPLYMQYDAIVNIDNCPSILDIYSEVDDKYKLDYLYFKRPLILNKIIELLNYGLGDRIFDVVPKINDNMGWDVGTKPNMKHSKDFVTFGLHLNSSNMFKVVNKGPQAYDTLADKFRTFWGSLSELRRFKDGSITEAVYWSATNVQEKRNISKKIIEFVLKDKLKLSHTLIYNEFDPILQIYTNTTEGCVEESNLKVINLFDDLCKKLRELDLPLSISAIQGISQSFCHSDPFPPKNMNYKCGDIVTTESDNNILFKKGIELKVCPKYISPVEGIIQMVHHSKWPNDITAMKYLRSAFYLQISEQLCQNVTNIRTNISHDHLQILYQGIIFRFTLFHPKEIQLLKAHKDDRGVVAFRDTPASLQLEKHNIILPRITGTLNGVHSQHPSYGPATILMKRWLNAQLLDDFFIDPIIVSLLGALLYIDSAPFQPPTLPQIAFFRFLLLLVNHPFSAQPLIINFNDEITKQQRDEFETKFQQHRCEYPAMCIITPFDLKSTITEQNPTIEILNRATILAKECLDVIERNIQSQSLSNVINGLFTPNLSGYNVIIHIQQLLNPRRNESIAKITTQTNEEFNQTNEDKMPIIEYNPVELYLRDLRQNYNKYALFFHDGYGGDVIAVLWKPIVFQKQQFKISNIDGMKLMPDEDKLHLQVNVDALIEDFVILGNGIIKNIDVL